MTTVAALLETLSQLGLVEPARLQELARSPSSFTEPRTLARELVRRGWLTGFQINRIMQDKAQELVMGSFVLLDRLGTGNLGDIYKARHKQSGSVVALRTLRKDSLGDAATLLRWQQETDRAIQLRHANIASVLGRDRTADTHLLVLEYLEGTNLKQLVERQGPLPIGEACEYVHQATLALQYLHEQGLVHRDIKPAHLFLVGKNQIKLLDIGLASLQHTGGFAVDPITHEGAVTGTVDYLAPEQARDGQTLDIRADLYSLGCTFYFLLTGRPPFAGKMLTDKLFRHQIEAPLPVDAVRKDVPSNVAEIVAKLMAKRPEERYQSPAEVTTALRKAPKKVSRPVITSLSAFFVLLSLLLGLWWFRPWMKEDGPLPPEKQLEIVGDKPPQIAEENWPGLVVEPRPLPGIKRWQLVPRALNKLAQAAFSDDGDWLALADREGILHVYDCRASRLHRVLLGHRSPITALAWSRDAARLVSSDEQGVIHAWDIAKGTVLCKVTGHPKTIQYLAWKPNGKEFLSACEDFSYFWDMDPVKRSLWPRTGTLQPGRGFALSPDGEWFVRQSGDKETTVEIFSVTKSRQLRQWTAPQPLRSIRWSPDGEFLAAFSLDENDNSFLNVWALREGVPLLTVATRPSATFALAWHPNSGKLAWGKGSNQISEVDIVTKKVRDMPWPGQSAPMALNWNKQELWGIDGAGQEISLIAESTGKSAILTRFLPSMGPLAWSPDGKWLASGGRVWSSEASQPSAPRLDSERFAWLPDRLRLATIAPPSRLVILRRDGFDKANFDTEKEIAPVQQLAISPDGRWLVTLTEPKKGNVLATVLDAQTLQQKAQIRTNGVTDPLRLSIDPANRWLALGSRKGAVQLWTLPDGKAGPTLALPNAQEPLLSLAWHPRGALLTAMSPHALHLWSMPKGEPLPAYHFNKENCGPAAWNPPGTRLAMFVERAGEAKISIWELERAQVSHSILVPSPVRHLRYHPKEEQLATTHDDGFLRVWDVSTGKLLWLGVLLPNAQAAAIRRDGRIFAATGADDFVYTVQRADGAVELLTPAEFRQRFGE